MQGLLFQIFLIMKGMSFDSFLNPDEDFAYISCLHILHMQNYK